jgi:hypothetical protein
MGPGDPKAQCCESLRLHPRRSAFCKLIEEKTMATAKKPAAKKAAPAKAAAKKGKGPREKGGG